MKVILTNDVPHLGFIGNVVNVKDGYARNYLIPRSFAVLANESNQKELEHRKRLLERKKQKQLSEVRAKAKEIEKLTLTVAKQVGEDERIFGTVTSAEISTLLSGQGFEISKKDISFSEEIKKVGVYNAVINLHHDVHVKVKVWVVSQ